MEGWGQLRSCDHGRARETVRLAPLCWLGRAPLIPNIPRHPQAGVNRDRKEKRGNIRKPTANALQSKCFRATNCNLSPPNVQRLPYLMRCGMITHWRGWGWPGDSVESLPTAWEKTAGGVLGQSLVNEAGPSAAEGGSWPAHGPGRAGLQPRSLLPSERPQPRTPASLEPLPSPCQNQPLRTPSSSFPSKGRAVSGV